MPVNELGQPVGVPVPGWHARPVVGPVVLTGRTVVVEPLGEQHVDALFTSLVERSPAETWTYLSAGPFGSHAEFTAYVEGLRSAQRCEPHVLLDPAGSPQGISCFLRIDAEAGSVEVGSISFSASLQRTTAATEAMYLMARHVFEDLGYRRYEWKCDDLNAASRSAALRLGFRYEGTWRNALIYKGRNRDTAWFSITDTEWALLRPAYQQWLAPENFDAVGRQRASLSTLTAVMLSGVRSDS